MKKKRYDAPAHTYKTAFPRVVLIGILVLSAILRLWHLSDNPPGLIPDEANYGYQAYSILETGKTMFGETDFLTFPQYGGGRYPPLYTYTLMPFIRLGGLSLYTQRLPSALFGIALSLLIYVFIRQIFASEAAALSGAALTAINPWALFYSRQGRFEMIGLFLVMSGVVLFIKALRARQTGSMAMGAILLASSVHANDAAKIVTPLLTMLIIWYFGKPFISWKKGVAVFGGIMTIGMALLLYALFAEGQIRNYSRARLAADVSTQVNAERNLSTAPLWQSSIFHNKATVTIHRYIENFTGIFSLNWFFVNGNVHMQESIGRHGQYHLFELPLFFLGLLAMANRKKTLVFLLGWMAVGHIPGAITTGPFAPYRSIFLLPVPIIFSSAGAAWTWGMLRKKHLIVRSLLLIPAASVAAALTVSFLHTYFFDFPVYSKDWRYKQRTDLLRWAIANEASYDRIFVNGNFSIEYAFLTSYPPAQYQASFHQTRSSSDPELTLGKYTFGSLSKGDIADLASTFSVKTLVLTDANTLPPSYTRAEVFRGAEPLETIYEAVEVN